MTQRHNLQCPHCGNRYCLEVVIECWAAVTDDGTDTTEPDDGSHTWNEKSSCHCTACGFMSEAGAFLPEGKLEFFTEEK